MRTTLDIDDDLLAAIKDEARRQRTSAGRIASDLLRRALTGEGTPHPEAVEESHPLYGLRPLPARGAVVTNDIIDRIRDEEGI